MSKCFWCRSFVPEAKLTDDHVEPRMFGGDRSRGNIVRACFRCNGKRGVATADIRQYREIVSLRTALLVRHEKGGLIDQAEIAHLLKRIRRWNRKLGPRRKSFDEVCRLEEARGKSFHRRFDLVLISIPFEFVPAIQEQCAST